MSTNMNMCRADLNGDTNIDFSDLKELAESWLDDDQISDHVKDLEIAMIYDYESPTDSLDPSYEFDFEIVTDFTVERIEVQCPGGTTFELTKTPMLASVPGGWIESDLECRSDYPGYEWYFGTSYNALSYLDQYGEGTYVITVHYGNGTSHQTNVWYGIPNSNGPIAQPTQEPVITSVNHEDTLTSPLDFTWGTCTDSAAQFISFGVSCDELEQEYDFQLPVNSTGLPESMELLPGLWEAELGFEVWYKSVNSDGIPVEVGKYSESDYRFYVVDEISDHVLGIWIEKEYDYQNPDISTDTSYGFEIGIETDDSVERMEFQRPDGDIFEITNAELTYTEFTGGWSNTSREYLSSSDTYEWCYYVSFDSPADLAEFESGDYQITVYYQSQTTQQTTVWFGIPGTTDPVSQPIQKPVITSFNQADTITSPVDFSWNICTDSAAQAVWLCVSSDDLGQEYDFKLPVDSTGLPEPLNLQPGSWEAELDFEVFYSSVNSDGIPVEVGKYSESDYDFTVSLESF
jgi:hypothetical protein